MKLRTLPLGVLLGLAALPTTVASQGRQHFGLDTDGVPLLIVFQAGTYQRVRDVQIHEQHVLYKDLPGNLMTAPLRLIDSETTEAVNAASREVVSLCSESSGDFQSPAFVALTDKQMVFFRYLTSTNPGWSACLSRLVLPTPTPRPTPKGGYPTRTATPTAAMVVRWTPGVTRPTPTKARSVSEACASAFRAAASVSEYRDKHEDLFPAYSACTSIEEWKAANGLYPKAIDGVDPVRYAMTVCANNQRELGATAICQSVNVPAVSSRFEKGLRVSSKAGLLGAPLPEGAQLIDRTPGDPAAGRDPSERYSVAATAREIAAFFDREMPKAGWAKEGTSTETALIFQRRNLMIGVFMNRNGGTFTLMGS